jgi:hypothetical protein
MNLLLSLSIVFIATTEAFIPSLKSHNTFFPFKVNELAINTIDQHNVEPIINHIEKVKSSEFKLPSSMLFSNKDLPNHDFHLIDNLNNFIDENKKIIGRETVMKISSFLPHFDQIGHKVLHANNEFISYILSLNNVPDELKKDIILTSIKMSQHGDNFGSYLLQMYYDIVHYSL